MKRIALIIGLLLSAATCRANLDSGPDKTILLSSFDDVMMVDSFAVAVATKGIAVFQYNSDSSLFEFKDQLFIPFTSATMKRFGDTLVVNTDNHKLYFVDISTLPSPTILGSVDIPQDFGDFALRGEDLYVSEWFDGVWRYRLNGLSSAAFADSSMKGILVSQLDISDDTLYVLDEYNGVLRYDLSGPGFGRFIDYLYVPFRVSSFEKYDSLFCLLLNSGGVYFGNFDEHGGAIVDSIPDIPTPLRAYQTDSLLVVLTQRQMFEIKRSDFTNITTVDIPYNKIDGDLFASDSTQYLVLPGLEGGLSLFSLCDMEPPVQGLFRWGLIADMFIYDHRLFTSGTANPVDVWQIGDSARITHDYAVLPYITSTNHMTHNGDSLVVEYPEYNKVGVILNSLNPDSLSLENAFSIGADPVRSLQLTRTRLHNFETLIVDRPEYLDVFILADSGYVTYINQWNFIDRVVSSTVVDTFLYVALAKRTILVYAIRKDFTLKYLTDFGLSGTALSMYPHNNELYVFGTDRMAVLDISDPPAIHSDTVIYVPFGVVNAQEYGGNLYGVSPDGISVFDLNGTYPTLVQHGGVGGNLIAAGEGILAVSGGNGIYIYDISGDTSVTPASPGDGGSLPGPFTLAQNYPNPFNPTTIIQFSLSRKEDVKLEIYNILGQIVATPVNSNLSAGPHRISFDGSQLASGVYFYRLTAGTDTDTKKMMLVK
jgi:hypothetical protein